MFRKAPGVNGVIGVIRVNNVIGVNGLNGSRTNLEKTSNAHLLSIFLVIDIYNVMICIKFF